MKRWISMMILLLLVGCTTKEEKALLAQYKAQKSYHKQLQKTEKVQLKTSEGITKVLLSATYLYTAPSKKGLREDEVFIVGMYAEESEIQHFDKEGFSLRLGAISAKSIKALDEHSPKLKMISFLSPWHQFYEVHFPYTKQKQFDLVFKSRVYGEGKLHFAKQAKYLFSKEGF